MSDDDAIHNELAGRELLDRLPISKNLMSRIDAATNAEGEFDNDVAVPALIAAVVALERLVREN